MLIIEAFDVNFSPISLYIYNRVRLKSDIEV